MSVAKAKGETPNDYRHRLENFKGIRERVEIELRPITLLFGANSAGKSTVLHAPQYASEVFERHHLNPDSTTVGGNAVELGGFRNFAHAQNTDRPVRFCRWRERVPGEKLHARYVLTERGGIHFEVGLDSGDPGQTTDVSLLNDILHRMRWAEFQPSTAAFDLVDDFTIIGG